MATEKSIKTVANYFLQWQPDAVIDEEAVVAAYRKQSTSAQTAVKVVSIVGGCLAALALLGFFFAIHLFKSAVAVLVSGIACYLVSIFIRRNYASPLIDSLCVSLFILGFYMIGFGGEELHWHGRSIMKIFILLSGVAVLLLRNYLLLFVSFLIMNGSIVALLLTSKWYYLLIHGYTIVIAMALALLYMKEAVIISLAKRYMAVYQPLKMALMLSFIGVLFLLANSSTLRLLTAYQWVSSVAILAVIGWSLWRGTYRYKKWIVLGVVLTLLPTVYSPAIVGALFVIGVSFAVNHRTAFVLGLLAFVYFMVQYYYDLHFSLLLKSMLLLSSGILFLGMYFFTHRIFDDEKSARNYSD